MADGLATGRRTQIVLPLQVSLVAYTAGDVVGRAFELADADSPHFRSAELESVNIAETNGQAPPLDFYFFNQRVQGSYVDNSPLVWGADINNVAGLYRVVTPAGYVNIGGINFHQSAGQLGVGMQAIEGHRLWVVIVTPGSPTFASAADLKIKLTFKSG